MVSNTEKEALNRHQRILLDKNDEMTRELESFVSADQKLREELDRKARVIYMHQKNHQQL